MKTTILFSFFCLMLMQTSQSRVLRERQDTDAFSSENRSRFTARGVTYIKEPARPAENHTGAETNNQSRSNEAQLNYYIFEVEGERGRGNAAVNRVPSRPKAPQQLLPKYGPVLFPDEEAAAAAAAARDGKKDDVKSDNQGRNQGGYPSSSVTTVPKEGPNNNRNQNTGGNPNSNNTNSNNTNSNSSNNGNKSSSSTNDNVSNGGNRSNGSATNNSNRNNNNNNNNNRSSGNSNNNENRYPGGINRPGNTRGNCLNPFNIFLCMLGR